MQKPIIISFYILNLFTTTMTKESTQNNNNNNNNKYYVAFETILKHVKDIMCPQ